ncbi:MAG TPA: putative baseplate assembly protein [Sphingomicrobium sp.]
MILDRMALTAPGWSERHAPDLGMTLVELLAYAADDLSYYQDAVATEAYLGTARLRRSVRRHVRLVDYRMDEGRSAEGWARLTLSGPDSQELAPRLLMFTTSLPTARTMVKVDEAKIGEDVLVFEASEQLGPIQIRAAHNEVDLYDWGESECCLAKGATRATLRDPGELPKQYRRRRHRGSPADLTARRAQEHDIEAGIAERHWHHLRLSPGDVLILAERLGPRTGQVADADPNRRHAVRLTSVDYGWDPLTGAMIVEIAWCPEDALPFPLCLSTRTEPPDCESITRVSVAYGNIVPVDHGRCAEQDIGCVPIAEVNEACPEPCEPAEIRIVPGRYRPPLPRAPAFIADRHQECLTACEGCGSSAASRRGLSADSKTVPAIRLRSVARVAGEDRQYEWVARADLLDSAADDRHFVVETDDEGGASLRFGNGVYGREPEPGECFTAFYRIGGGARGNIGPDSLRHVVFKNAFPDGIEMGVSNPLPMRGGRDPESVASARLRAPFSFRRRLERAVTAEDYAAIVMRDFPGLVQRAAATLRSSGVRTEVQVAIDPRGSEEAPPDLLACIERYLERYRRIEHDVRVVPARYVPIELALEVCVAPGLIAEDVGRRVREKLGTAADGFFNSDALTFGGAIAASRIVAAVHAVEGVAEVRITALNRLYEAPDGEIESGLLPIGAGEIARLDQDPDAPENGLLTLIVKGGR